jgi:hypothetical protein
MTIVRVLIALSFGSVLFATLRTQVPEKSGTSAAVANIENITAITSVIVIRN